MSGTASRYHPYVTVGQYQAHGPSPILPTVLALGPFKVSTQLADTSHTTPLFRPKSQCEPAHTRPTVFPYVVYSLMADPNMDTCSRTWLAEPNSAGYSFLEYTLLVTPHLQTSPSITYPAGPILHMLAGSWPSPEVHANVHLGGTISATHFD